MFTFSTFGRTLYQASVGLTNFKTSCLLGCKFHVQDLGNSEGFKHIVDLARYFLFF